MGFSPSSFDNKPKKFTDQCTQCGRTFETSNALDRPLYCPECEDYNEMRSEEEE